MVWCGRWKVHKDLVPLERGAEVPSEKTER